jgi:hypothetical protein
LLAYEAHEHTADLAVAFVKVHYVTKITITRLPSPNRLVTDRNIDISTLFRHKN